MSLISLAGDVIDSAKYTVLLPNLILMTSKPSTDHNARGGTAIDEIVLHGTESSGDETASANSLTGGGGRSIHYFIGRGTDHLYSMVPEDQAAWHAGNPHGVKGVEDHNERSIGIEMYQRDISFFNKDASKLDFTDWQYDTVAMLVYDIRRRRNIARNMVVSHASLNPVERGDPRNFDWDRFNRKVDGISAMMASALGPDYALS